MSHKYPMLYVQTETPNEGVYLKAYDITDTRIFVGKVKLTDILDLLEELREEIKKYER